MKSPGKHATITAANNHETRVTMIKHTIHDTLRDILFITGIALAVLYIYHQTFSFDFINFDDPIYVTDNQAVKNGLSYESLSWAFGIHEDICMYYQPVAWISHMIDVELWGLDPGKHHRTSVIIHILNVALLFLVLKSMTGSFVKSAFAASFFAVHPVNMDSVSWIAERKTLVSAFFWFLGMASYQLYIRKPGVLRYGFLAFFFTLGLLTKPVMITFPCVLLLLDIWPLKRIDLSPALDAKTVVHLIVEKIPLFIITGLWFITPFLSHTLLSNETTPDIIPHSLRIANALVAYVKYTMNFFVPANLSILYPYPSSIPFIQSVSAFSVLLVLTLFFIVQSRKRPWLIMGWLWFLGVLFPTSGLILGTLWPAMADRWAYIPYIGLSIIVSWAALELTAHKKRLHSILILIMSCHIAWLAWTTGNQVKHWQNSLTIFEKALTVTAYHYLPHQNIAVELMKNGHHKKARKHLLTILDHEPGHAVANYNMGLSFYQTGDYDNAQDYLFKARSTEPGNAHVYIVAVWVLKKKDQFEDAIALCEDALEKVKKKDGILYELSLLLAETGEKEAAELRLIELLSTTPHHIDGMLLYADLLLVRNDKDKALFFYRKALSLSPGLPRALTGISMCSRP